MNQEIGWHWHQLDHMQIICIAPDRQSRQHLITQSFTGWMLFLTPNNSVKAVKANIISMNTI